MFPGYCKTVCTLVFPKEVVCFSGACYKDAENLTEEPRFVFERIILANIFNRIKNKSDTNVADAVEAIVSAITNAGVTIDKYAPTIQKSFRSMIQCTSNHILGLSKAIRLQELIEHLNTIRTEKK